MFEAAHSLLSVFSEVERVKGRKKIQKMIHLLEVAGTRMPFKYEYHYYGPYSAELQAELNDLVAQGFLTEKNPDDSAYIYEITEKGRKFKEMLDKSGQNINLDCKLLHSMAQKSSPFLEMLSTYAFLIDSGYEPEKAKQKAIELKSHLKDLMDQAIAFYEQKVMAYSEP